MKPLKWIQRTLRGRKISSSSNQFVVFRAISDWLRHFCHIFWKHFAEFNLPWQQSISQRSLPSCFFRTDRKTKMAALASEWLGHFDFRFETTWIAKNRHSDRWNLSFIYVSIENPSNNEDRSHENFEQLSRRKQFPIYSSYYVHLTMVIYKNSYLVLLITW